LVASEVELECQGFLKLGKQLGVDFSISRNEPFFYFFSHLPFDFSLFVSFRFSLGWVVEDEAFEKVVDKNVVDVVDFAPLLVLMCLGKFFSPVRSSQFQG